MAVIAIPISFAEHDHHRCQYDRYRHGGKAWETSLSATALANQFVNIYQICCMGIAMGVKRADLKILGNAGYYFSEKDHNPDAAALHRTFGSVYAANHIDPSAAYEDVY